MGDIISDIREIMELMTPDELAEFRFWCDLDWLKDETIKTDNDFKNKKCYSKLICNKSPMRDAYKFAAICRIGRYLSEHHGIELN